MKEYRSAIRSRELIREALCEMLKEKEVDKISVADIVKTAKINRSTFYAHYQDMRALHEEIENELLEEMYHLLDQYDYHGFFAEPYPIFLQICKFLEERKDNYKVMIGSSKTSKFLNKVKFLFEEYMVAASNTPDSVRASKGFAARSCFFVGGIVSLFEKWLAGSLDMSAEELATELTGLIRNTPL